MSLFWGGFGPNPELGKTPIKSSTRNAKCSRCTQAIPSRRLKRTKIRLLVIGRGCANKANIGPRRYRMGTPRVGVTRRLH